MRSRSLVRRAPVPLAPAYPDGCRLNRIWGRFAPSRQGGPMTSRLTSVRRVLVLLVLAAVAAIPTAAGAATFPDTIRLPDGWQPEGIASGRGTSLYVGSIPTGGVWKGDARTGQ